MMTTRRSIQLASGVVVTDKPMAVRKQSEDEDAADRSTDGPQMADDDIHRGTNKSGRPWKTIRKEKASMAIYKPLKKTLGTTWVKRQEEKQKHKETKELQAEMLAKRKEKAEAENKKNVERKKRKAENELKSAKVQVMSHPEKIKKMSKKQLRSVYKTRMGDDGVVRLVGAYE